MFKIAFLFLSLFNMGFFEDNYRLVYEEKESDEFIKQIQNYYLYIKDDSCFLKNSDTEIEIGKYQVVDFFMFDEEIIVITLDDGTIEYRRYEYNLKHKKTEEIIRDGALNINSYYLEENKIYIVGKSGEDNLDTNQGFLKEDAYIIEINKNSWSVNYYGGIGNEEFLYIFKEKENLYLLGRKDKITEGDFGNGGRYESNIFISILNSDKKIIDYKIIDRDKEVIGFDKLKNEIFVIFSDEIISYDLLLNPLNFEVINHQNLSYKLTEDGILALFSQKNATFIDFSSQEREEINYEKMFEKVEVRENYLLLIDGKNEYKGDVLLFKDYDSLVEYERDEQLFSLFGKCDEVDISFEPFLDYQVYGDYSTNIKYKTRGGVYFEIESKYVVPEEVNVTDGGIYPVGYRLLFTGKGYLNGQYIINNYQIVNSGEYLLELIGANGEVKSIEFHVDEKQIVFTENNNIACDIEVNKNQNFNIKMNLKLPKDHKVESVIIDGEVFDNIKYESINEILFINMLGKQESGVYEYNIEKINLSSENFIYSKEVNINVKVNVISDNLHLELSEYNELTLVIDANDYDNTARYFEVVLTNGREEKSKKYPICNSDLLIDLDEEGLYNCEIYLISDTGGIEMHRTLIVNSRVYGIGRINLGKILINKISPNLERFSIEFNDEESLREISINKKVVYENLKKNKNEYIFYSIGTFIMSLIITIIIKEERRKKKSG